MASKMKVSLGQGLKPRVNFCVAVAAGAELIVLFLKKSVTKLAHSMAVFTCNIQANKFIFA
jgi:hypothetical protein